MRGSGGILLDAQGKRFANELTTRSVLTDAIFKAGAPMPGAKKEDGSDEGIAPIVAYLVLNEEAADAFGTGVLGFYMSECAVGCSEWWVWLGDSACEERSGLLCPSPLFLLRCILRSTACRSVWCFFSFFFG